MTRLPPAQGGATKNENPFSCLKKKEEGNTASCYDCGEQVDSIHHVHTANIPRAGRHTIMAVQESSLSPSSLYDLSLSTRLSLAACPFFFSHHAPYRSIRLPLNTGSQGKPTSFQPEVLHRKAYPKRRTSEQINLPGSRKSSGRPGGHRSFPRTSPVPKIAAARGR